MKSYCYSVEKAKKEKYEVNCFKISLLFLIPILLCLIFGYLALKVNVGFLTIGIITIITYITLSVLNIVQCGKAKLISIVKYTDNALYILINNNLDDLSWFVATNNILKKYTIGAIAGTTISMKLLNNVNEKYKYLSKLMTNEEFLRLIFEDSKNKISKGIEIYKIMSINSYIINDNSIEFEFDGFEKSNCLLYKGKKYKLLNVYNDFDELGNTIKEYNDIGMDSIEINSKKEKEYNLLFEKNYKMLKNFFNIFIFTTVLNLINTFLIKFNPSIIICIQTMIFSVIAMYFEPTKNTNLNNKKINHILKYSIFIFILNIILIYLRC